MRIKVLQGTVRVDREYKVGEELNLPEGEAQAIIRNGVAEEVMLKETTEKAKPKAKPKAEPKEVKAEPEQELEPSIEWTRKELNDHAKAHGVEEPEKFGSKKELLIEIKGGDEGEGGEQND